MKKVVCHISKCLDAKPSAAVAALTLHAEGIQDGEKENTDPELRSLSKGCPMGCSLAEPSVHQILQERILVWVAVPFSRGSSQHKDQTSISWLVGGFFATEAPGKPKMEYCLSLKWSVLARHKKIWKDLIYY